MKNTMISKEELEALEGIFKSVDHFVEVHKNSTSEFRGSIKGSTKVEELHTIVYLGMVKDLIKCVTPLKAITRISEEEFIRASTQEGKKSLDEVLNFFLFRSLMECLEDE